MAGQPITLDFETSGSLLDDIRALADAARGLGEAHAKAQAGIQADLTKSSEKALGFSKSLDVAGDTVIAIGREASRGGAANLGKSLESAAGSAAKLGAGMEKAGKAAVTAGQQGSRGAQQLGRAVQQSQAEAQASVKLTAEQYVIIQEEIRAAGIESEELTHAIAATVEELATAGVTAEDLAPSIEPAVGSVESLQRQLRAAKLEAGKLAAEFGLDSEQALEAQRRVAELTDEVGDLKDRFDAFNPDKKFEALNQVAFSLQGGLFAVQSLVQSFAGENEALNRFIGSFQALLFASQGLQTLFGGLGDALKTLRAVTTTATAATTAGAAASTADTAAKTGQAAATAAVGTASAASTGAVATLTSAFRTMTAVIVANPLAAVAVAIGAIVAAIALLSDTAEDATKRIDGLLGRLQFLEQSQRRTADNLRLLADVQAQIDEISADDTPARQRELAIRAQRRQLDLLDEDLDIARGKQEELLKALESLNPDGENYETNRDRIIQAIDDVVAVIDEAGSKRLEIEERTRAAVASINEKERKDAIDTARARRDAARDLARDLVQAERDLATRLRQAQAEAGGGIAQVELERENNEAEIAELEKGFGRKLALIELQRRLSTDAWQKLSDAEREARADAMLASGDVTLPAKEAGIINSLKLLAESKYLSDLDALYTEQAKARLDLIADTRAREERELELDLEQRAEVLRKAGATEQQILEFQRRERSRFSREGALADIALDQQIAEARINAQQQGTEREADFERRKQLEILAVKKAGAQASLGAIVEDGTKETALLRAQFEAIIAETDQARARLLAQKPAERSLLSLLGIKEEDEARVSQALNSLLASTQQIISAGIEARQQEVQAAISATDEIISDAQRRRTELQAELDRALQDQREGYANNADAIRDQIEQTKRAETDAMEERKRLILESRRIAQQQVRIDGAVQISALLAANARLFEKGALAGPPGIIAAVAAAVAMFATFLTLKNRITAAGTAGPQFRRGGVLKDSTLLGPLHEEGGIALLDRRTGHYYGEAEGGEGIVSRKAMSERGPMVHAINVGDIARLQELARAELIKAGHMVIRPGDVRRMHGMSAASAPRGDGLAPLLAEVAALRDELAAFRRQEAERERVDGRTRRLLQHTITTR